MFSFSSAFPATPRLLAEQKGERLSSAKGGVYLSIHTFYIVSTHLGSKVECVILDRMARNTRGRKKDLKREKGGEESNSKVIMALWIKTTE